MEEGKRKGGRKQGERDIRRWVEGKGQQRVKKKRVEERL